MSIRIYWASVTGNRKIVGEQTRLRYVIEGLGIESQWIDITTDAAIKQKMREECGNPTAMPPQIFLGDRYLGDVPTMEEFMEEGKGAEWFGIKAEEGCDVVDSVVANGLNSAPMNDVASKEDGRLQESPTSSIENQVPTPPILSRTSTEPPPTRKNVLAAAGAFEALSKQPPPTNNKPKVIFTQSRSHTTNQSENKKPLDDDRRLRILGLSGSTN